MKKVKPAATIMLCRDNQGQLEVLLLKRNTTIVFGGIWVFPGGKVEPKEIAQGKDDLEAATLAAVRETKEETDLDITKEELIFFRHWTTPIVEPRRYSTWFFYGESSADAKEVKIDDSEIKQHLWLHPQAAIDKMKAGELTMMPPTIMSLQLIRKCQTVTETRQKMEQLKPIFILPVLQQKGSTMVCLFEGDAGYELGEADTSGARHRLSLNMKTGDFDFEYQGCDDAHPVNEGMHL